MHASLVKQGLQRPTGGTQTQGPPSAAQMPPKPRHSVLLVAQSVIWQVPEPPSPGLTHNRLTQSLFAVHGVHTPLEGPQVQAPAGVQVPRASMQPTLSVGQSLIWQRPERQWAPLAQSLSRRHSPQTGLPQMHWVWSSLQLLFGQAGSSGQSWPALWQMGG